MNHTNYTLFEIIKYKIVFFECLEYSLNTNTKEKKEIKMHLSYLKNELNKGMYKEITSSLFTSFKLLNEPIIKFLDKYNYKKLFKLKNSNKLKHYLRFMEYILASNETFNYITKAFIDEEKIVSVLDKKILNLIDTSNDYFANFLFFNCYNLYLNCFFNDLYNLKHSNKHIKQLISIINYCNKEHNYDKFIEILKSENKIKINDEFEILSKICIESEKQQQDILNKIINTINHETKKSTT